jgi:hypothetical protein
MLRPGKIIHVASLEIRLPAAFGNDRWDIACLLDLPPTLQTAALLVSSAASAPALEELNRC